MLSLIILLQYTIKGLKERRNIIQMNRNVITKSISRYSKLYFIVTNKIIVINKAVYKIQG